MAVTVAWAGCPVLTEVSCVSVAAGSLLRQRHQVHRDTNGRRETLLLSPHLSAGHTAMSGISVSPLEGKTFGCRIEGLRLDALDDAAFAVLAETIAVDS